MPERTLDGSRRKGSKRRLVGHHRSGQVRVAGNVSKRFRKAYDGEGKEERMERRE